MAMASTWEIFPADLDRSARFYVGLLGFTVISDARDSTDPYLAFRCGEVVIGASLRPAPTSVAHRRPPIGVELGLEVDDLDTTYAAVLAAHWPLADDIQHRPWGVRDFRILDPDGYYLCIREHEYF
ncbi:VOC family protein [Gordonia soli]|uniref:VOC domain-containing protein n=1 Tax=Gordonia soli NBRC 108243 TaxID=1223545 RepID=M0QJG2_9ACTN|nr:VOC family protein [Gordonia soli]GAC68594.1 hypothetical protein GS4_16_01250 [Gordonia soli NBRC 108243]